VVDDAELVRLGERTRQRAEESTGLANSPQIAEA
jgi:hypothetical protein